MDQLTPDSTRRCPGCGEVKPLQEFVVNKRRADGRGTYCRPCFNERSRQYREQLACSQGREVRRKRDVAAGHKYCPRCKRELPVNEFGSNRSARDSLTAYCKPCHNAVGRETKQRLYGGSREYHLRQRYGIGAADVEAMIEAQGGTCAACPGVPEHVDHDHRSGNVRGILCFNCNQALGNVRDEPAILRKLARYLETHSGGPIRIVIDTYDQTESVLEVALRPHLAS